MDENKDLQAKLKFALKIQFKILFFLFVIVSRHTNHNAMELSIPIHGC